MSITSNDCVYVPTKALTAKDTTGAGDCFIGSFAGYYALEYSDLEAIKNANTIAGLSTQKNGTQSSYLDLKKIPFALIPNNVVT